MTTMASNDDSNKRKYATDSAKDEAEEALPKKQKTIGGNDIDDNHDFLSC
jgi:hypothetical protein